MRFVIALAVMSCAGGCSTPETGWQRLWPAEWTLHNSGIHWVLGVPATNRTLTSPGRGAELRMELLNTGGEPATVGIRGRGFESDWSLDPGESKSVATELGAGEVRFEASSSIILGSPRVGRPLAEPRLLVVVLVDTLRADHVTPELMPGVTGIFADGRRWRSAVANAPWTLPSVASLFTSQPVLELTSPEGEMVGIPDGLPTWATRLHDAGFEGGAVVANYTVHALNGFARGFSAFEVPDGHGAEIAPDAEWVADEARRWLDAHNGEDAFLYLHFMDPHEPYRSHTGETVSLPPLKPLARRQREATEEEARLLRDLYAGEVRHVDRVLSELLEELPVHASVVLTSDHGEGLGEHGAWAHGPSLFQEAIAVPLMARGPAVIRGDVTEPVQHLDLGPTLMDLAGQPPDEGMVGRSLLAGGSTEPVVSVTFSAGPMRWAWREGDRKVVIRMAPQPRLGAEARRRDIEAEPLPTGTFFVDLAVDPDEDRPAAIPDGLTGRVGEAFASTAGRMVPGLQVLRWGGAAPTEVALETDREYEVVQAWSSATMEASQIDGRFVMRCAGDQIVCAVSVASASASAPETVTPVESGHGWWGMEAGRPVDPRTLEFPDVDGPGLYLWWNPERPLVVGGHEETLERLRALGYID